MRETAILVWRIAWSWKAILSSSNLSSYRLILVLTSELKLFSSAHCPDSNAIVRLVCVKLMDRHTKCFVHGIVADKISAFSSLLCHKGKYSTVGFDFLDRFGLFQKGVNVTYDLNQMNDGAVAVHLSQDDLRKSQTESSYNIQRTHLGYRRKDTPCHISIWVDLEFRTAPWSTTAGSINFRVSPQRSYPQYLRIALLSVGAGSKYLRWSVYYLLL